MIDHGALNTKLWPQEAVGPDRISNARVTNFLQSLETAQQRVDKQVEEVKAKQDQVAESESKGHGKRLAQRQRALAGLEKELKNAKHKKTNLLSKPTPWGHPESGADRDFRKQTIMTVRTLLLENALNAFMVVLLGTSKRR